MANSKDVKRLSGGEKAWNAWVRNVGDIADLSGADLSGYDLEGFRFTGTNFRNSVLNRAKLAHSELVDVDFNNTQLIGADLTNATIFFSNLIGTKLINCELHMTKFHQNFIRNADFSGAKMKMTIFADVIFEDSGLDMCVHEGPCSIDFLTLQKSGTLPLTFLRGLGLPDVLIEYLPSFWNQAIQHYSCFISYSAIDTEFARRLHADLQYNGIRCWFAPHDMPIGGKILDEIDRAIRLRDKLLLILSEHSIRSEWVEDEVTKAFEEERKRGQPILFPVRLDDAVMDTNETWAAKLRARHIGDFTGWKDHDAYTRAFEVVVRDLIVSSRNAVRPAGR